MHTAQLMQAQNRSRTILTSIPPRRCETAACWCCLLGNRTPGRHIQALQPQANFDMQAPTSRATAVTHLKASQKAALPTLGLPKLMQRTSAVGHCSAIQTAATVAMAPPPQ